MSDDAERARWLELGAFLRVRRAAADPVAFGMPAGRRHVRGLRREEVARAARISASWYAMLEQGRARAVGAKTIERIAIALRLDPAEHAYLAELARAGHGEATRFDHRVLDFARAPGASALVVIGPRFDVLAWNAEGDALFGYSSFEQPCNFIELLLFEEAFASRFADRAGTLRNVVALLRTRTVAIGETETRFVESLIARSPEFAVLWAEREIVVEPEPACVVTAPGRAPKRYALVAFEPLSAPAMLLIALIAAGRP